MPTTADPWTTILQFVWIPSDFWKAIQNMSLPEDRARARHTPAQRIMSPCFFKELFKGRFERFRKGSFFSFNGGYPSPADPWTTSSASTFSRRPLDDEYLLQKSENGFRTASTFSPPTYGEYLLPSDIRRASTPLPFLTAPSRSFWGGIFFFP